MPYLQLTTGRISTASLEAQAKRVTTLEQLVRHMPRPRLRSARDALQPHNMCGGSNGRRWRSRRVHLQLVSVDAELDLLLSKCADAHPKCVVRLVHSQSRGPIPSPHPPSAAAALQPAAPMLGTHTARLHSPRSIG